MDVDTTPPETTYIIDSFFDVTFDATDETSGVDQTFYSVDGGAWTPYAGTFTVGASGVFIVEFYSVDNAGNAESVQLIEVGDDTPPETTAGLYGDLGTGGWYVSEVTVNLTATDDVSGVNATWYRVDGGDWTEFTEAFDVTGEGSHTVEFYSDDLLGNVETTQSVSFDIDTVDPESGHAIDADDGDNGWYTSSATVTLSGSDDTSGLADIMYRVDGDVWAPYSGAFDVEGDGSHTVEFYAVDEAGNEEALHVVDVNIDATAPDVEYVVIGVNVTLSATDDMSGVDSIMYRIDGGAWQAYTGMVTVTGTVGNHTVEFYAVDEAGNEGVVGSVVVAVPPEDTDDDDDDGGLSTLALVGIGLLALAVIAVLVLVLFFKRKGKPAGKGEEASPPPPEDL